MDNKNNASEQVNLFPVLGNAGPPLHLNAAEEATATEMEILIKDATVEAFDRATKAGQS